MKTFKKAAAQGDVYFWREDAPDSVLQVVNVLPNNAILVPPENGRVIVTHSETGHHHFMNARAVEMYRLPEEIYECFLVVKEATPLEHLRPFDTHESIMFEPGIYHVRRQREYTPEGWQRAAD